MILVATPGDPAGIGPEIVWKTLRARVPEKSRVNLLCIGARKPFDRLRAPVIEITEEELFSGTPLKPPRARGAHVWLLNAPEGKPGFQAGWSIEKATQLVLAGKAGALVTGPISKERLNEGGYPFPGHTEFLAHLCRAKAATPEVTMMLANDLLRITLVTTHLGLHAVPQALTREKIRRAVTHTESHLRKWWGIKKPRVAICALNPHAGEQGLFGDEEIRIITPEIEALRQSSRGRCELIGPLPADTLFANHMLAPRKKRFDAVVCMYHDQGLIPVKLVDFKRTVNVTLGLPMIRTSVDHGVAFDIAGKGIADPSSFQSALALAARLSRLAGKPKRS